MTVLAIMLAYSGLTALSLAMHRHHRQLWQQPASPGMAFRLRCGGTALLLTSAVTCILDTNWSFGLVAWLGCLSVAALVLVFLLPYAPRAAGRLAVAALPATLLLSLLVGGQ